MCGIADVSVTFARGTAPHDWMITESLEQFLDPADHSKTIEGYPGPDASGVDCDQA
ncbi:tRNA (mo5U34)-methyltransferase [Enterobacter asburiae]|uniref:tRNA (Mo5U34)-methyltransferase n=1 Tax=Enterobacter asburiae TaxID=61645 RepID=A0A376F9U6_ENTAS|nr:tRNA (mo5U34)-methyltransferase [Enterobacter asburiae]